jgi:hypothetical protein
MTMNNTKAIALAISLLAVTVMAAPTAAADGQQEPDAGPCDFVETMTFYPFVVLHPECLDQNFP